MAYDGWDDTAKLGDPNTGVGLRKHLVRRMRSMRAQRSAQESLWQEVSRFAQPTVNRYISAYAGQTNYSADVNVRSTDTLNSKLLDGRAVRASDTLGNGMFSGLSSPSRPWFKLTVSDPDLARFQAVKEWTDIVERRLYDLFSSTNFYTTLKSGYHELGLFGIEAGLLEEHWRYGLVNHPLTCGEFWIGVDDGLVPDSLYRRTDMSALQHCQKFCKGRTPSQALPRQVYEAYDRGNYEQQFPVYHAVEPNDLMQSGRRDYKGKRFRSVYWSGACDEAEGAMEEKAILSIGGFGAKPFYTARWDIRGSDIYASNYPGVRALADVRQLQLQALRKQQAIDFTVKPALRGPATLNNMAVALQPGRITAMAGVDKDSFGAIWEVDPKAIGEIREDIAETRQAVDEGFYADLFNAITNMAGIQPRNVEEIASRNEEKLTQLGPVVERVNQEKLKAAIDRGFNILLTTNSLPPPPPELRGVDLQVEFISVLAQAQRLIGLGGIERTFGFALSIAQAWPEAVDALDGAAAMAEYGDITGMPAKLLRAEDEAKARTEQRNQAQAQAAQAEQAATMAPAAKAGAETAALLYSTPGTEGAPTIADRLLGT